jgi:uncharacterized protein
MKILIAGASGFLGRYLIEAFRNRNYRIVALSRNPQGQKKQENLTWKKWNSGDLSEWLDEFENSDVVINLVGESLASRRWTQKRKKVLLESRINSCKLFVRAYEMAKKKPAMFIQSSAIGYYAAASSSNEKSPAGDDFLADISVKWEQATEAIENFAVNRIRIRTGVVLADDSLIIKKFKLPFRFFIGGHLGTGQQIISWVHIDDVVQAIQFIIDNVKSSQIFNLTAPNPVSMEEFCQKIGQKMHRPSWFHVPAFLLNILFGQVAEETMLKGHKIIPENLLKAGYNFRYNDIDKALSDLKSL